MSTSELRPCAALPSRCRKHTLQYPFGPSVRSARARSDRTASLGRSSLHSASTVLDTTAIQHIAHSLRRNSGPEVSLALNGGGSATNSRGTQDTLPEHGAQNTKRHYSMAPSGKKYCVPLTGSCTRFSNCCKSSLLATKAISEVSMTSRSEASYRKKKCSYARATSSMYSIEI